jgi:hypothetical protein
MGVPFSKPLALRLDGGGDGAGLRDLHRRAQCRRHAKLNSRGTCTSAVKLIQGATTERKLMQDLQSVHRSLIKSGAGPRRWSSLALGAVAVIPIVLAIGGGAAEGQSESAIAPHSRAEVQQALRRQKPGVVIPQPLPRPPEAPPRPKRAAEPAPDEEGGTEQRSHQTQPKQTDVDCQMRL